MRRLLAALALALLAAAILAGPVSAQEESQSVIRGTVTNGTPGGDVPAGVEVLLRVGLETELVWQRTTTTAADGRFSFADVPSDTRFAYAFDVTFDGALYRAVVDGGPPVDDVEMLVYAATSNVSDVSVGEDVLLLPRVLDDTHELVAMEAVTVENSGTRTLVPNLSNDVTTMNFLRFSLPSDAVGLDVRTDLLDGQVIEVGQGFALVAAIPPGRHQVLFTYRLPYGGGSYDWERSFPFGAGTYRVLLNQDIGGVVGMDLTDMGTTTIGDRAYHVFEATSVDRGAKASVRFEGLPAPSLFQRLRDLWAENTLVAIPVVLGAALAALVGVAIVWRRRRQARGVVGEDGEIPRDRASILRAIAALDQRFEEGEIAANHYRRHREALLAGLRETAPEDGRGEDAASGDSGATEDPSGEEERR